MSTQGFDEDEPEDEPEDAPWSGPVRMRTEPDRHRGAHASAGRTARPSRWPRALRDGLDAVSTAVRRRTAVLRRRARTPLARRVARGRAGALVVAAAVATSVGMLVRDAEAERRRWGPTVVVAVVRGDHDAGDEVGPDSVELVEWPAGLAPATALHEVPAGRRFANAVADGELLSSGRVARSGASSAAARLPHGRAAVTVPLGPAPPPLEVGDRVDVLAPPRPQGEPWEVDVHAPAEIVATSAEVIGVEDGHATLVVDRAEVEQTAAAILEGTLTLALTG